MWGTKAPAELGQRFARAWMTKKAEVLPRRVSARVKKAAKAQELAVARWLREQALVPRPSQQTPQELQKQKPEPTGLLEEWPA